MPTYTRTEKPRKSARNTRGIRLLCGLLGVVVSLGLVSSAAAQIPLMPFGVGGDNPASENSRTPFQVRFKGFINSRPDSESLAVVSLGIAKYSETYQFEVVDVKAVNLPKHIVTPRNILQQAGRYDVDYNVVGKSELLSKIAQAPPGTPLQIEGMFQQRKRKLILLSVEQVTIVRKGDPDHITGEAEEANQEPAEEQAKEEKPASKKKEGFLSGAFDLLD